MSDQENSFNSVLHQISLDGSLTIQSIERLSKIFSVNQISKVKEIMSEIVKIKFNPSDRQIWMKLGTDRDYILYPKKYCSCMDFFLQGIQKNKKYYCKHLIAQGIVSALSKNNPEKIEKEVNDEDFKKIVTQQLELEHFLDL